MAFGHDDCDQIYNRYILPILKKKHVEPIRVDMRQHKDDLNNYIIRMLKESDIALADLTYARPSVYYEAGFAERQIPVVYTARKDHLSRAQVDDGLRVHFDLEMKKIIAWSSSSDRTFGSRLRQRLTYLLRPIREKIDTETALQADKEKFLSMSVHNRCQCVLDRFCLELHQKRFWVTPLQLIRQYAFYEVLGYIGAKQIKDTCHICCVLAGERISKSQIYTAISKIKGSFLVSKNDHIKKYFDHYFFCTLKSLPESSITSDFPHAKPMTEGQFILKEKGTFSYAHRVVSIHTLPSIESKTRLDEYAKKCFVSISDEKSNNYSKLVAHKDRYYKRDYILFSHKKLPGNK